MPVALTRRVIAQRNTSNGGQTVISRDGDIDTAWDYLPNAANTHKFTYDHAFQSFSSDGDNFVTQVWDLSVDNEMRTTVRV
jgi:hypothetical protein